MVLPTVSEIFNKFNSKDKNENKLENYATDGK